MNNEARQDNISDTCFNNDQPKSKSYVATLNK